MQLYKIFYWPAEELMHRETVRTMFREAESPGKLIRELMENGMNVERVIPYTQEEYEKEMRSIEERANLSVNAADAENGGNVDMNETVEAE
jgi:DNA-dependent RNA polymerase auxiliary subunit epsilon